MNIPQLAAEQSLNPPVCRSKGEPFLREEAYTEVIPQGGLVPAACSCGGVGPCTCGATAASASYIYALGTVQTQFPSLSVEKEFYQAVSPLDVDKSLSDALLFKYLSQGRNRYIAREMCWTFEISITDAYVIKPRSEQELTNLISALAPRPDGTFDVVIGLLGPLAPPEMCNGLALPILLCDKVYTFTYNEAVETVKDALPPEATTEQVVAMLKVVLPLLANVGQTDAQRAVNFLIVRYMGVYTTSWEIMFKGLDGQKYSFIGVETKPSDIQGTSRIIDVIFSYRGETTHETVQWYTSVNVQDEFPYIVTYMTRYYGGP